MIISPAFAGDFNLTIKSKTFMLILWIKNERL